ncbi:SIS domain-containing protein [Leifsonia sp. 1010]|uniref:SIS domain-containing protein n=1 Tax=Leifsonia sp. 1010 TaxID=2817769 RepID=UPI00285792D4|nr:SIS domain-containing protein [Leifsonia sp. 1010]MDR6611254.1 tagatose-6-phosphate ketose/aldose isomerase [Leifsonia sp. 1010]
MPESRSVTTERAESEGSRFTVREICHQPEVWHQVATGIAVDRSRIDEFLAPLLARPDLRIVLTGAGTSAFVGGVAAPELSRLLSRRIEAIATTDLVSNPREFLAEDVPTLLVSFARSGNSPESVAATRLADECLSDVSHLIVTCDPAGQLNQEHRDLEHSCVLLMPAGANDQGFAMTSSFTSMLLSVLLVFGGDAQTVEPLIRAAEGLVGPGWDAIADLAAPDCDRVVYLGSGPLTALARESALKLLELTAGRVVSHYDSSLGFRHGPKSVLNDRTLVVVFLSSDEYTRRYDLDIVAELRDTIDPARVVAVAPDGVVAQGGRPVTFDGLDGVNDAYLASVYVVVAQILALSFALHVGTTPDNPFPDGNVNRVVKGVRLYPLGGDGSGRG